MILLSIQIPTTDDRQTLYAKLEEEIRNQCVAIGEEPIEAWPQLGLNPGGWRSNQIEFLYCKDDKGISIGAKRDILYKAATGLYSWQIDSDDFIAPGAIGKILPLLARQTISPPRIDPTNCITFEEKVTIDGVDKCSNFSLSYIDWADNTCTDAIILEERGGFDYIRTPFFKTPILTGICQKVGVKDMRFGEDHDFARRIKPWLKTEVHIPEQLYWYRHTSSEFNERYGIE